MADLRELGRQLVERPPVVTTPSEQLRRRWRRRRTRRAVTTVAVLIVAAVGGVAALASGGSPTSVRVQVISPPVRVSPTPVRVSPTPPETATNRQLPGRMQRRVGPDEVGSPIAVTWVGAQDGWVLKTRSCGKGTCAGLEHTTDGGRHWAVLPDPPAMVSSATANCAPSKTACVGGMTFATANLGYLYGPSLLVTTNGGRTWTPQRGPSVDTMAIAGDQALRVGYTSGGCPGPCQFTVQAAKVGSDHWQTLLDATRGDGITSQILAAGPDITLVIYGNLAAGGEGEQQAVLYRSTDNGASWTELTDPCVAATTSSSQTSYLTQLAATTGGILDGLCVPQGSKHALLIRSTDDGANWDAPRPIPETTAGSLIAAASPTTLAVATVAGTGNGPLTAELRTSTDGGVTWTTSATEREVAGLQGRPAPAWIGFQTPRIGRWVSGPNTIWTTRNGGRTWTRGHLP